MTQSWDQAAAERRIAQLEAALMRRSELLETRTAQLASIQASTAWKFVELVYKLRDRLLPMHSRRRAAFKWAVRKLLGLARFCARQLSRHPQGVGVVGLASSPDPASYARWYRAHEPDRAELARQRQTRFGRSPTISVLVPVYNTPANFLHAMIDSVRAQTYANWELILADGASSEPHVRPTLEAAAAADPRIKPVFLTENGGIVGNSNAGLAHCRGEYVALLDHDDTLAPFALFAVVEAINHTPDADLIYSDEDKLDPHGVRVEPHFKPDWSPELLRSRNYICHLTVLRRPLLEQLGGFRSGFDGAQDYDLVLRASERARRIVHIPQILYHWRMHPQSTAHTKGSKSYAFEAGKRALADHFARLGIAASVHDGPILGVYQPIYHLPRQPLVSVIVPNRDHVDILQQCVESLASSSYANYELLIVENHSREPATFAYYQTLASQPHVRILRWERPFNYAAVNNFAAAHARGELLLFLNNDVQAINPDWLEVMVKQAIQPGVGAVGAKLYYPDDTIQHAGIVVGMGGIAGHAHLNFRRDAPGYMQRLLTTQNVAAVTGACLLMPRAVFEQIGGFDEGFVLAFNDVDICLQVLAAGLRVVWTPQAELYHLESKTRGPEDTDEKQARFKREIDLFHTKWAAFLAAGDPYYSPHFRLDRADFALRS